MSDAAENIPGPVPGKLTGRIEALGEIRRGTKGQAYFDLGLEAEGLSSDWLDEGLIRVRIYGRYKNALREDLIRSHALLEKGRKIRLLSVRQDQERLRFCSTAYTLLILEPDYLVDVTDIAGCFHSREANPMLFFLDKLLPSEDSLPMLKGKLINDLLDSLLKNPEEPLENIFSETLTENLIPAAKYGREKIRQIWQSVLEEHRPNIEQFCRQQKGKDITTEPTFLSPLYGIQGRLDILNQEEECRDIIELKSGKAPSGTASWESNRIQTACYDMLLESCFGPGHSGRTQLFYSSAHENPLRETRCTPKDKIAITDTRNKILWGIFSLSRGDERILKNISPEKLGAAPSFKQDKIIRFADLYARAASLEKAYYIELLAFGLRELIAAKIGGDISASRPNASRFGFSGLWLGERHEKEENCDLIPDLSPFSYDPVSGTGEFHLTRKTEHNFRPLDIAILYRGEDPLKGQIYKTVVKEITPEKVVLTFRNRNLPAGIFDRSSIWNLEHDLFESNFWAQIRSLIDVLDSPRHTRELLLGQKPPEEADFPYPDNPSLNPNQNGIIRKALRAKDYFMLQGPPGTGKTSVALINIVREILSKTGQNIVILAYTNRAVDEICEKLQRHRFTFLRLGHQSAAQDQMTIYSLYRQSKSIEAVREMIRSQRVIVSTVSSFASRINELKDICRLDTLIVDEASQLTELQIAGIAVRFKKFIFLGDQKQLPAVIGQSERLLEPSRKELNRIGIRNLGESLFSRLYLLSQDRGLAAHGMLKTHYRMHRDIARLINPYYENSLSEGTGAQRLEITEENILKDWPGESRVVFIESDGQDTAKMHPKEAAQVVRLLEEIRSLYGEGFNPDTVGVVTPFRAQISNIRNRIADKEIREKVAIDTVERFQGGEKDIIILSSVISHPMQLPSIQSLDAENGTDRKMIVTLSRARKMLILLGNRQALSASPFYHDLLARIEETSQSKK